MTFAVSPEAYDRFVGRYAPPLARELVRVAGVEPPARALDVGSGPGGLTAVLADFVGPENVAAIDPSEPFVAALRERLPGVDARVGRAEELPFADGEFDAVFAQLVVNFMADPVRGVAELRRVTRPGGVVAASVWDYGGEMVLLNTFWAVAAALGPERRTERDERSTMRYRVEGELAELWRETGLREVEGGALVVTADYEAFDGLWEPLEAGVGPAGAHVVSLSAEERARFRAELHRRLGAPSGPFRLSARAWYAVGRA